MLYARDSPARVSYIPSRYLDTDLVFIIPPTARYGFLLADAPHVHSVDTAARTTLP